MIYDSPGYVGFETLNQFLEDVNNKFLKILDFLYEKNLGVFPESWNRTIANTYNVK